MAKIITKSLVAEAPLARTKEPGPGTAWRREFELETVERAAAEAPALTAEETRKLCKAIGLEYLAGYEGRVVQFKFTDGTVDRYGDMIVAKGVDLTNYKQNPQILGFHDSCTFPIGRSLKTWYDKASDSIKGWVLFLDDRVDKSGIAETVYRMVKAGVINTGSIGFMPRKYTRPDEATRVKLGMGEWGYLFEEVELVEFSIVPVPANPSAMAEPITKGLVSRAALDTLHTKKVLGDDVYQELLKALPTETAPEAPAAVPVPGQGSVRMVLNLEPHALASTAIMASVAEYKALGYEVVLNIASQVRELTVETLQPDPVLADIVKELKQLREAQGPQKRELPEETRNLLQNCVTTLEQSLVALQNVLDAGSADATADESGKGAPVPAAASVPPVSPEASPAGEAEVKGADDLYDADFLAKLDRATQQMNPRKEG